MTPVSSRRLAHNVGINFVAQVVPLLAALVAIPILIHDLGAARFGILSLVWAAIGYFGLFDFGIGRALTHVVATRAESSDDCELAPITWTALALMLGFGAVGGVVLALVTPVLMDHWLNVPLALRGEGRIAFYIMGLSLPFSLAATGMRGVMEGFQDFRVSSLIRAPLGVLQFLAPLAVLPFSHALPWVVATLFALRLVSFVVHVTVCVVRYPALRHDAALRPSVVLPLVRFGGWMTVSNVVSPLMVNMDRFMIGALLPMASVAYYVTPYELVTKLFLVPTAVLGVMFPAFSTAFTVDRGRAAALVDRTTRVIFVALFPATLLAVALAHDALAWWVGPTFASEGGAVLQWLAVGVLVNCTAGQVAYTALQSAGRPDLTARVHLAELPVYVVGIWFLVHSFGLVGVAIAWTLRVTADALAMYLLLRREIPEVRGSARTALRSLLAAGAVLLVTSQLPSLTARLAGAAFALALSAAVIWKRYMSPEERAEIARLAKLSA